MKVNIEMDNLAKLIEESLDKNINNVIKQEVDIKVKEMVDSEVKSVVKEVANKNMVDFVNDYIKNATITVGGGFYSDDEAKTFTIENYIKNELAEVMKNKTLKIKSTDRYGDGYKTVSFEDFIKSQFDAEELAKKELTKFTDELRKEINNNIKNIFDEATKSMLSEAVLQMLMNNETYQKITSNVKCLANKEM